MRKVLLFVVVLWLTISTTAMAQSPLLRYALTLGDLSPGYMLDESKTGFDTHEGKFTSYTVMFNKPASLDAMTGFAVVSNVLWEFDTPEVATIMFSSLRTLNTTNAERIETNISPPSIGDETIAHHYTFPNSPGMDGYNVMFRRDNIISYVLALSATSTGSFGDISAWAALVNSRIPYGPPITGTAS